LDNEQMFDPAMFFGWIEG